MLTILKFKIFIFKKSRSMVVRKVLRSVLIYLLILNSNTFLAGEVTLRIPSLSTLRDFGSSMLSGITHLVSPKSVLTEEEGRKLKEAIIESNLDDIKSLTAQYDTTSFWTIEEIKDRLGRSNSFDTPLRLALYHGSPNTFSLLLDATSDPNFKMRTFKHILNDAVALKKIEYIKILLDKKSVNVEGDRASELKSFSPLSDAISMEADLRHIQSRLLADPDRTKELVDVSQELADTRKIIALFGSRGIPLYTPRTNERLLKNAQRFVAAQQKNAREQ